MPGAEPAAATAYFASFTADDWACRAKERGVPADLQAPDLFTPKEFRSTPGGLYDDALAKLSENAVGSPGPPAFS